MKTRLKISILNLLLILGLSFQATTASAGDEKTYNGSMCKAYVPSEEHNLVYFSWGIYNYGPGLYITCPIIKDDYNGASGSYLDAYVGTNSTLTCWHDENQVAGGLYGRWSSSLSTHGWLNSGSGSLSSTYASAGGHRNMWCYLPSGAYITHINVYEYGDTGNFN